MGLFDFIRHELIEIIEWVDTSPDTLIWKFPDNDYAIKQGAQLTVRESQVAILLHEGRVADVFGPGRHVLATANLPVLTTLQGWKYGFESPFKVDVYFVATKQFTNLKWGTPNPVILRDADFQQVRVRAFGTFALRVRAATQFLTEFAGTSSVVRLAEVEGQFRAAIVNKFSDTLAEANVSVLDLARNYHELGERLRPLLQDDFGAYGLELTRFYLENASLPPEVEAFLDKTTQMNMAGDMGRFQQFQAGLALEKAADQEGGIGGAAVLLGGLGSLMSGAPAAAAPTSPSREQTVALLRELGQLKNDGILTEAEFEAKKAELLARL